MRKLSEAATPREAERLIDQLLVANIEAQLRGEDPWEVWVLDDRDMPAAKQQLEAFAAGDVPEVGRRAAQIRERAVDEQINRNFVPVAERWRASTAMGFGPITAFLLVASLLTAFYSGLGEPATLTVQNLSIEPWDSSEPFGRVSSGEVWRLLTPMLVHFGLLHLLFNMSWLWSLGRQIEQVHGSLAMLALVLASAVPGNVGQYLITGPNFGGMSGVVYGLFGFVWMQARYDPRRRYRLEDRTAALMMIWFVACATGLFGPIANVGHGLGLVVGLIAGTPVYVKYLRDRNANPEFVEGNWADVHLQGWRRWARRYYRPFVPLWFLLIAALVVLLE
jgi:GlpG protein